MLSSSFNQKNDTHLIYDTAIFSAAEEGNIETLNAVKNALSENNLDIKNYLIAGENLLQLFLKMKSTPYQVIEWAVFEANIDPYSVIESEQKNTLHLACQTEEIEKIRLFLNLGVNQHQVDKRGNTPFDYTRIDLTQDINASSKQNHKKNKNFAFTYNKVNEKARADFKQFFDYLKNTKGLTKNFIIKRDDEYFNGKNKLDEILESAINGFSKYDSNNSLDLDSYKKCALGMLSKYRFSECLEAINRFKFYNQDNPQIPLRACLLVSTLILSEFYDHDLVNQQHENLLNQFLNKIKDEDTHLKQQFKILYGHLKREKNKTRSKLFHFEPLIQTNTLHGDANDIMMDIEQDDFKDDCMTDMMWMAARMLSSMSVGDFRKTTEKKRMQQQIEYVNDLIFFVVSLQLRHHNDIKLKESLVDIAHHLIKKNKDNDFSDFLSASCIYIGLNHGSTSFSEKDLSPKYKKRFEALKSMFDGRYNFSSLRVQLQGNYIPYLQLISKDLTALDEGGVFNANQEKGGIVSEFLRCQDNMTHVPVSSLTSFNKALYHFSKSEYTEDDFYKLKNLLNGKSAIDILPRTGPKQFRNMCLCDEYNISPKLSVSGKPYEGNGPLDYLRGFIAGVNNTVYPTGLEERVVSDTMILNSYRPPTPPTRSVSEIKKSFELPNQRQKP